MEPEISWRARMDELRVRVRPSERGAHSLFALESGAEAPHYVRAYDEGGTEGGAEAPHYVRAYYERGTEGGAEASHYVRAYYERGTWRGASAPLRELLTIEIA